MNKFLLFIFILLFTFNVHSGFAQDWGDSVTVRLEATVQTSPAQITLTWNSYTYCTSYTVYRKLKSATTWGTSLAVLPPTSTSYADATALQGVLYDYRVMMNPAGTSSIKYGYISSGIEVPANSNRGIAIIVIEHSYLSNPAFQTSVNQTVLDLELDGWYPKIIYVDSSDAVATVKTAIMTKYNEDPSKTKLLFLLGHVPVPYSGDMNPDGHADHMGAWPTDTYYADKDGPWFDASVNDVSSANPRNHNVPGDGKFDHSYMYSTVELEVGRVDLAELPAFSETEEQLLLRYMDKLHRYKTSLINVSDRGLIDDNFGAAYPEGFCQNGYRNFSTLVGRANIVHADYFTDLSYTTSTSGTYLWSYGCGGGTYTSAGGIGTTTNFTTDTLSSVFTMLFGSYFGDWNYKNSFLRAPLAQGNTLTNCWAGRPNWHFYHMAMGDNIGYSTQLTQNNMAMYYSSSAYEQVSINLMGDPALRMHYITPPTGLSIVTSGSNALSWTAGGSEIGYNVYRRYADSTDFVKLNGALVTATNFTDMTLPLSGTVYYYVKAVELKTTPSGSYYNESLAARDSALFTLGITNYATPEFTVYPNPSNGNVTVQFAKPMQNATLKLYSTVGNCILERSNINGLSSTIALQVPAGIYYLTIHNQTDTYTKKLIIEK